MPISNSDLSSIVNSVANANTASSNDISGQSLAVLCDMLDRIDMIERDLRDSFRDSSRYYYGSQSNVRDRVNDKKSFKYHYDTQYGGNRTKRVKKGFVDSFEDQLVQSFKDSDFGKSLKKSLSDFSNQIADAMGMSVGDTFQEKIGRKLADIASESFKRSNLGKSLTEQAGNLTKLIFDRSEISLSKLADGGADKLTESLITHGVNLLDHPLKEIGDISSVVTKGLSNLSPSIKSATTTTRLFAEGAKASAKSVTTALGGPLKTLGALGVAIGATVLAFKLAKKAISVFNSGLGDIKKGLSGLLAAFKTAGNRYYTQQAKNAELEKERIRADYNTMIEEPFNILKDAANSLYDAWKNNIGVISSTQQYTKADVQDLMSAFAARLKSEGLSSYVNGSAIIDNLTKVLESGLSGQVAEEFAYQATVLKAAIPTQDFFNYAATYASIAANAIKQGQSQQQAIQKANKSLQEFASGLLYASRELSGGFSTGLQDAQSLFQQATQIAQASKTGNISDIAGVLLAVRGEVGAIAPDLASSITDTIYKTLTGGNSSELVALRSLAGVNASNTEFLRAVATNPQKIFSAMFENLAKMYTQSPDAYMEKAEGYSQLFGLTSEAFQRIDFSSLASAISSMNMNNSELSENLDLLIAGQTTTSDEQLRMQQINQYMLEEGLSLVLDNGAAQAIQQHMWDEQMKRELQESTFAVDLQGAALESINLIKKGIDTLAGLLNPFKWFHKTTSALITAAESTAQKADVKQLLELVKVGQGNSQSMYQLTTYGKDLNVTNSLVSMLGGSSNYERIKALRKTLDFAANPFSEARNVASVSKSLALGASNFLKGEAKSFLASYPFKARSNVATVGTKSGSTAVSSSLAAVKATMDKLLSDNYIIDKFVKAGKSFDDWAASAKTMGISDLSSALDSVGTSITDVKAYFQEQEASQGADMQAEKWEHEKLFRDTGISFWSETFFTEYKDPLFSLFEINNQHLQSIVQNQIDWKDYFQKEWIEKGWQSYVSIGVGGNGLFNKFYQEFMKYFINHTYYSNTRGYTYEDVEKIQKKSRKQEHGDTVNALAEMLTTNLLDLKDPTMQTNAILSQILIVVSAIMNQNNEVGGKVGQSALLDSLSAMALGLTANSSS